MMISHSMRIFAAAMVVFGSVDAAPSKGRPKASSKCPCNAGKPKPKNRTIVTSLPGDSGADSVRSLIDELVNTGWVSNTDGVVSLSKGLVEAIEAQNKNLQANLVADEQTVRLVEEHGLNVLFVVRDPRDQLVKTAHLLKNEALKFADCAEYRNKSIDEVLLDLIKLENEFSSNEVSLDQEVIRNDEEVVRSDEEVLRNEEDIAALDGIDEIDRVYELYTPWINHPRATVVRYEALVGSDDDLNREKQVAEIIKVAQKIGVAIDAKKAKAVAEKLFAKEYVKSGFWRDAFTQEHKDAFKAVAGQLLIDLGYEQDLTW